MFALLILSGIVLSSPFVQTKIINTYTKNFKEITQQNISLDKIAIRWNGDLEFSNLFVEDHHGDTLLFIGSLQSALKDYKKLRNFDFQLSAINAEKVVFNLTQYPNDSTHSLKILLDKLNSNRSAKETLLTVETLSVSDSDFRFRNLSENASSTFHSHNLNIEANELKFYDKTLELELNSLNGDILKPLNQRLAFSGKLLYSPGKFSIDNALIQSGENSLKGHVIILGKEELFSNFLEEGTVDILINEGQFDGMVLFPEKEYIKSWGITQFKGHLEGSLKQLQFNELHLANAFANFNGKLEVIDILKPAEAQWKIDIDNAFIHPKGFSEKGLPNELKRFFNPNKLNLSGQIRTEKSNILANVKTENPWGTIIAQGSFPNPLIKNNGKVQAFLNARVDSLSLSVGNEQFSNWKWGGNLRLTALVSPKKVSNLQWNFEDTYIKNPALNIAGIHISGLFEDRLIKNTLNIDSPKIRLKSDMRFDFNSESPQYTMAANIEHLDLNTLGIKIGSQRKDFNAIVLAEVKGQSLDDLEGEIKLSQVRITNDIETILLNPISLSQRKQEGLTRIEIINTDCIEGTASGSFKTSELKTLLQNTLHHAYPFLPAVKPQPNQQLTVYFKVNKKLLKALYPDLGIDGNITLKGRITDDLKRSSLSLDAPFLRWEDAQLQDVHLQIDTNNPLYSTFLSVENVLFKKYKGKSLNLISAQLKDTLFFRSEFMANGNESPYELNFYHTLEKNGNSHFGLKRSSLLLGSDEWVLNPNNAANQKISYIKNNQQWKVRELSAISKNQFIKFSGEYLDAAHFKIDAEVLNVTLQNILPQNPTFNQNGVLNFKAAILRSDAENSLNVSTEIKKWKINNQEMGDFNLTAKGNTQLNTYNLQMSLEDKQHKSMSGFGVWQGSESPTVNVDFSFNAFDTAFLSPLGKETIQNIRGKISGAFNLWGPLSNLKHNGMLSVSQGGFAIPYLNIDYQLNDTNVQLYNQKFNMRNVVLTETAKRTQTQLNGYFEHKNFSNWITDLTFTSNRMLLLNTEQKPESLFYGTGFLDGSVRLEGPFKNLKIDVVGGTDQGTSIKIPWSEDYGLTDTSFITFIEKNNRTKQKNKTDELQIKEIRGLEMNFELDVTPEARIEIVIDQETGSFLNGRGAGNLLMEINTNGKFNMWGDFITFDGIYNFKNLGVIDKKFNLKPGGTIVWEGNPLEAQMNLEAVYNVPGGANPALLLDNPNFNKNIPTEVLIRLQGNLLKPDNPVFEINFPNTSGVVASEINYRLADPQRSQLQAISLLSQGIFINEVSVSMQGITNNLYQKASDIITNLIGEENDKLKVGIDYLQGDKSALLDIATEDRLGFTLSTQISDRILLNGKIGVPVGGLEQTLIVGNVQIDFILNEEGSLRAKVFNKENEFRYIGDELGYTQGLGLTYQVDFNTFKELVRKIININKTKQKITEQYKLETDEELIQFVNKN